jgi:hypothetical protein
VWLWGGWMVAALVKYGTELEEEASVTGDGVMVQLRVAEELDH